MFVDEYTELCQFVKLIQKCSIFYLICLLLVHRHVIMDVSVRTMSYKGDENMPIMTEERPEQKKYSPVLNPEQVAKRLNVKMPKVWKMFREGELPGAFQVVSEWRIHEDDLEQYILDQMEKARHIKKQQR